MIEQVLPFAEYLKEKTLFPSVKRILNFCFVLGISSFLFEKFYFKYSLFDITDYKRQFEFFAHGAFIVPFSIFFIIWALTNLLGEGLFTVFNYIIAEIFRSKILNLSFNKDETITQLKTVELMVKKRIIARPGKEWFVRIYESLKANVTPKEYKEMRNELEKYKRKLTSDSILVFRALFAVFIYFSVLPQFGLVLLTLLLITLLSSMLLLVIGYQIAELVPTVIQKVKIEMERYINENYPATTE